MPAKLKSYDAPVFRETLTSSIWHHNRTFTGILYSVGEPRIPLKIAAARCIMTAVAESLFVGRSLGQCNKRLNISVAVGGQINSKNNLHSRHDGDCYCMCENTTPA